MYLIVGLGNPGSKYEDNRHNIGFKIVDAIAEEYNMGSFSAKYKSEFLQENIWDTKIGLLKPQTFMNLSGHAVRECAAFYKVAPKNILVIHDEVDLEFARIKVKMAGGAGGHNGLKSVDSQIGNSYKRLRFGVGRGKFPGDTANFVLSDFSKEESVDLDDVVKSITKNIKLLIDGKDSDFMNKVTLETRKQINIEENK